MSDRPVAETSTLTTHSKHKRQTSVPPAGFELWIFTAELFLFVYVSFLMKAVLITTKKICQEISIIITAFEVHTY